MKKYKFAKFDLNENQIIAQLQFLYQLQEQKEAAQQCLNISSQFIQK
jgi:hypothetical protein